MPTLMLGTTKGLFLAAADGSTVRGPFCDGWSINHAAFDAATGTIWAGGGGEFEGAGIWRSADNGETWQCSRLTRGSVDDWYDQDPSVAEWMPMVKDGVPFGDRFGAVWSLLFSNGALYAGTKGAILLKSTDGGASFEEVEALTDFPGRADWNPGAVGLTLHTIVPDPSTADKLWVGISAAGVYATEDGGASWEPRMRMSNADACTDHDHPAAPSGGNIGGCVHNMVRARGAGDILYQQNHHGVWRSGDGGRSWDDITEGLPSTFGFPIAVDPDNPAVIWTIPLNGDSSGRFPPDASAAVWRSTDGGDSWEKRQAGLPDQHCYFTVLRQAMTSGTGFVAFGTNSGSIFASTDGGESWDEIVRHLPTILSVELADD